MLSINFFHSLQKLDKAQIEEKIMYADDEILIDLYNKTSEEFLNQFHFCDQRKIDVLTFSSRLIRREMKRRGMINV